MASKSVRPAVLGTIVMLIALVAFAIAWASARETIARSGFLRDLPRATLGAPKKGPAIYAGRLDGPAGRVTPMGTKSAITWWWVMAGTSKKRETTCFERQLDKLELRGDDASLPYVALSSASSLSLLSDERDYDWDDPMVVDLGKQPAPATERLPAAAAKCNSGTKPKYNERWVAQGAEVEVVACYRDGALRECDAPLRSVLALGTIAPHRLRRADHAYFPFAVAGGVSTALLVAFLAYGVIASVRTFSPLRPSRRPA